MSDLVKQASTKEEFAYKLIRLQERIRNSTGWFYAIGSLSILNSVLLLIFNSTWSFPVGLSITQIVDSLAIVLSQEAADARPVFSAIAFGFNLLLSGMFFWAGRFVRTRKSTKVYLVGLASYVLDGLLALLFADWIGLLFHGIAIGSFWNGWAALKEFHSLDQNAKAQAETWQERARKNEGDVDAGRIARVVIPFTLIASLLGLLIYMLIKRAGL